MQLREILRIKGNLLVTIAPDSMVSDGVSTMSEKDIGSLVGRWSRAIRWSACSRFTTSPAPCSKSRRSRTACSRAISRIRQPKRAGL